MDLTVSAEVAAVDVAIECGADLCAVECRVEGRLQAIGGVGRETDLCKTLVPAVGSCLAVAVEVGVRGFGLQVLQRARFAYPRESGAERDAFASAYLIVVEAEDDAMADGLTYLPLAEDVWGSCTLDAGSRARELRGEVDLLIASPAVRVAEARDLCGRDGTCVAIDGAVPVHRLVQIEDDAD